MTDGYVKYSAEHTQTAAWVQTGAIEPPHWAELNEARTRLHTRGLVGVLPNGIGYGNLSIRYRENEFIISGTATGALPELTPGEYCLVNTFDLAQNRVVTSGPVQASSESMTHGAVYQARSGVNCVIHIHSRSVFDGMIRDKYPATPVEAAYGTPEIALAIGKCVTIINKDESAIALAGHDEGVIAYGASVEVALRIILELNTKYGG